MMTDDFWNRPCAAEGLRSYRYAGHYGWIMIGAKNDADALFEAQRNSSMGYASAHKLQVWNGHEYVPVTA